MCECARLQSFPDNFIFEAKLRESEIRERYLV
ncbi:MAG: hypothetical protein L0387_38485 [Acidobacteria bacterium]|nr:hypothetical protein [Acidobacteriota bacterium]MCI0724382.1 hypothetical protein [Acidobacteriota bacterium]